nr:BREX-1 system phosphatase PglZ type B [Desulfobulbaceae bacterium]
WPDYERQWEAVIPLIQEALPELFVLGSYASDKRMGPAIWLRCVMAGKIPEFPSFEGQIPIFYLPGFGRQDLRVVEDYPEELKPIAELQYRGSIWSQYNGKDWSLLAYLKSEQGGLGLEVAQDLGSREAMKLAFHRILDEELDLLKGKYLNANAFNSMISGGDLTLDILQWIDQGEAFKQNRSEHEWDAFVALCNSETGFHPQNQGVLEAAKKLAEHAGQWENVWNRYREAPHRYPNIPERIRSCPLPEYVSFYFGGISFEGWPQWNDEQEKSLEKALLALNEQPPHIARRLLIKLNSEHGERRDHVWCDLGESPLAKAMEALAELAELTGKDLNTGTLEELAKDYASSGWKVDYAVLRALAGAGEKNFAAIQSAIRTVYLPWLENSAHYLQKLAEEQGYPGTKALPNKPDDLPSGCCVLFIDGLRMDTGRKLSSILAEAKCDITEQMRWAPLPSVTSTGKPAATPVACHISGKASGIDFEPQVKATGQLLKGGHHLKKLLENEGWQLLGSDELGDGKGRAWCEFGNLDHEGHDRGWKIATQLENILQDICGKVLSLIDAGWSRVDIVTDHGWLLLPGGLPKIELSSHLVENKWGRYAAMKSGATSDKKTFPWYWNNEYNLAVADGISVFRKGLEYSHGGLSLQECVIAHLTVTARAGNTTNSVSIREVKWNGLRCRVSFQGTYENARFDLRTYAGDSSSSLVNKLGEVKNDGTASIIVEDEKKEGHKAFLVLLNTDGDLVFQTETLIGGE